MINTNEKLLDSLDADQYFLISKIVKYGKKSCPKNEVLRSATGWGIKKVQRVKKELIGLGLLVSNIRWKYVDGKRMRDSNEYVITTKLISKYRGKESFHISQIGTVQIGTDEGDLVELGTDEFELDENGTGFKVLRILIIEKSKLLNLKGSIEETPSPKIKKLELEIEQLKTELKNKEKSSAKKESGKHVFPDLTSPKTYVPKSPKQELENGQKKPYEIFLSSYPFEKKGWSEKLKQIFLTYCEIKNEKSYRGYATAQIKLRLAEINEAIPKHEISWIEEIVTSGANGAWADFQFDDRIKNRKDKAKKDKPNSNNDDGTPSYMLGLQ